MTRSIEAQLQQQRDFVHANKEMVRDPEKVKLSQRARLVHRYRAERQTNGAEPVRQCRCHTGAGRAQNQGTYPVRGYEGIINLNQRHYLAFNSRPYSSIAELSDLRTKPQSAVDRTNKMTKYFMKEQGKQMKKPRKTRRASARPRVREGYQTANIFLT